MLGDIQARAFAVLGATPPNGQAFRDDVQRLLRREKNWISWKNLKCQSFAKEQEPEGDPMTRNWEAFSEDDPMSKFIFDPIRSKRKVKVEGNRALLRQEKMFGKQDGGGIAYLVQGEDAADPTLAAFLRPVRNAIKRGIAKDHKRNPMRNTLYCWRALRLLSKDHIESFGEHMCDLESAVRVLDGTTETAPGNTSPMKKIATPMEEDKKEEPAVAGKGFDKLLKRKRKREEEVVVAEDK